LIDLFESSTELNPRQAYALKAFDEQSCGTFFEKDVPDGVDLLVTDGKTFVFSNLAEYKIGRDSDLDSIISRESVIDGKTYLDFSGESIAYSDYARMIEMVNFESKRCNSPIATLNLIEKAKDLKANCE